MRAHSKIEFDLCATAASFLRFFYVLHACNVHLPCAHSALRIHTCRTHHTTGEKCIARLTDSGRQSTAHFCSLVSDHLWCRYTVNERSYRIFSTCESACNIFPFLVKPLLCSALSMASTRCEWSSVCVCERGFA